MPIHRSRGARLLAAAALAAGGTFVAAAPAAAAGAAALPALLSDGWADPVGSTPLTPVIKAAGGDKADKANPDVTDTTSGAVLTGAGVGVALIDSGVTPVAGLNGPGKVVNGPDLSFESQAGNLRNLDTYGHGTHMAGIIAGQDPATTGGGARFTGVAPGARIISVKTAGADGATDVSQIIAAVDWTVEHRNDPGLNIRVLNLSYGTDSVQAASLDPLSYAVEQAWNAGIVVVVAAGNDGFQADILTMPAANPTVIAVGAADTEGTDTRSDDEVATFSNRGNLLRHPDLLAPGRSIVSLRDPGSYIDRTYPAARLNAAADPAQRYFRGSGTSQAAAIVSGTVALLLQQRPGLKPDEVKRLLMNTATPLDGADPLAAGRGQIDIAAAAKARTPTGYQQLHLAATGLGSLEQSRGSAHVYDPSNGAVLTGERDIFGDPWKPLTWTLAASRQLSWVGGAWNGAVWAGPGWGMPVFGQRTWAPVSWLGRSWSGGTWGGRSWSGAGWTGRSWSSQTWSGRSWSGRSWSSAGWTGDPWH